MIADIILKTGGWGIVDILIAIIIIAAVCMVVWIGLKNMGVTIPNWVIQILWIVAIAIVCVIAIKLLISI